MDKLFAEHIASNQKLYETALAELEKDSVTPQIDAVLIHSGSEGIYFADDMHIPFEAFGHFNHWLPLRRPDQMVLVQSGKKPIYFQVVRPDFWYDQTVVNEDWWASQFEIVSLTAPEQVMDHLPETRRIAFMGENTAFAAQMGLPSYLQNEKHLTAFLDYHRGAKTAYEVEQLREANRMAMAGHEAARQAFLNFGSELEIHTAFLAANQMLETDSPYTNIVALDEKAAILHYQYKQTASGRNSKVLLIDAGCRANGYCSDITRTYHRDDTHPVFRSLLAKMDVLQQELVGMCKPGLAYLDIHKAAHDGVLNLLIEHELVSGPREELVKQKISSLFYPHGTGHLLGLQVHDVGGYFKDPSGATAPPPDDHKFLRLNRTLSKGMVLTIEPGLYFIPVLLDPLRNTDKGKLLNWKLIEELIPYGGIRIEDNIHVTDSGPDNLTR